MSDTVCNLHIILCRACRTLYISMSIRGNCSLSTRRSSIPTFPCYNKKEKICLDLLIYITDPSPSNLVLLNLGALIGIKVNWWLNKSFIYLGSLDFLHYSEIIRSVHTNTFSTPHIMGGCTYWLPISWGMHLLTPYIMGDALIDSLYHGGMHLLTPYIMGDALIDSLYHGGMHLLTPYIMEGCTIDSLYHGGCTYWLPISWGMHLLTPYIMEECTYWLPISWRDALIDSLYHGGACLVSLYYGGYGGALLDSLYCRKTSNLGTVVFHCHSAQKQLWMVTAFLLTSTLHIPTHHHAMRAWNNYDHLVFIKTKLA